MTDYYATPAARLGGFTTGKAALEGTFSANGSTPWFTAPADKLFNISFSNPGGATVKLQRSWDGGVTVWDVTDALWTDAFSGSWFEPETGVWQRLTVTGYVSAINYRVSA